MADAMQVGFRTVDGVRVRCAERAGAAAPSVLLASPWPVSVCAFALIWFSLADVARLVAVDLPGFGRSGRRDDLLSPRAMGEFLARLVAELTWLAERLPEIEAWVLMIAGRRDGVVLLADAGFLGERLLGGRLVVGAGHFVWGERADGYAALIADWVAGGYREAAVRGRSAAVLSSAIEGGHDERY